MAEIQNGHVRDSSDTNGKPLTLEQFQQSGKLCVKDAAWCDAHGEDPAEAPKAVMEYAGECYIHVDSQDGEPVYSLIIGASEYHSENLAELEATLYADHYLHECVFFNTRHNKNPASARFLHFRTC